MKSTNVFCRWLAAILLLVFASSGFAAERFRLAWSLYPAFMPWAYASHAGIVDKWAKKYGVEIEVVQINDYIESINQYTAGSFDICLMATMDALTIPAAAGVDSTVLALTDYSAGNDVIILKQGSKIEDLRGKKINLVQFSVSHYFLARALQSVGMSERDVTLINTSDADLVALYQQPSVQAMVTWNPMASEILKRPDATKVLDSHSMPGELTDGIIVNSKTLGKNPGLGKALAGAWFETLAIMKRDDNEGKAARKFMADASGTDLAGFEQQLAATHLYDDPARLATLLLEKTLQNTMTNIVRFSFEKGLLGSGVRSADAIGVAYPGGVVQGDSKNIKLRFDDTYLKLAADGKL